MKAAVLTGIGRIEIEDVPIAKIINDTDVLIRIKTVGVCGSDIHYFTTGKIGNQVVEFPFILGHETAGVVEKIGRRVKKVKVGDRVAIEPSVSCVKCDQCKAGREHTCRSLLFLGCPKQLQGCLSEYIVMPEKCCFPIKRCMTFEQAVLSEPLAIGIYTVEKSMLFPKANVAVLGLGPIGMSVLSILRTKKTGRVYVTDKIEARLSYAKKLKPKWSGNPDSIDVVSEITKLEPLLLDIVYECSGDPQAIKQAIELLKPGGNLVLVGIPETDEISFPIHELRRKEITIINIRRQVHCTQKAINLIAKKEINIDWMVTHRFKLEDTQKAFDLVAKYEDGVMKAMIYLD